MRYIAILILIFSASAEICYANTPIGKAVNVTGVAVVIRNEKPLKIKPGFNFLKFDRLTTKKSSSIEVALPDDSVMALGELANIIMDEVVYDDMRQDGIIDFKLLAGPFRFVSGAIAKSGPDLIKMKTPAATIGIRGTTLAGKISGEKSEIVLLRDRDGRVGVISVENDTGVVVIDQENEGVSVALRSSSLEKIQFTDAEIKNITKGVPEISYRSFWQRAYDSLFKFQLR